MSQSRWLGLSTGRRRRRREHPRSVSMSGSAPPILVTGATGRHGSTGAHVARRLCEEGRPVRILARTRSERTDALSELGAEVVIGDLHDRRSLVATLNDVNL